MSAPDFFSDIVIKNDKATVLRLCERNIMRFALGDMPLTRDLQNQLEFFWDNANAETKELVMSVFNVWEKMRE